MGKRQEKRQRRNAPRWRRLLAERLESRQLLAADFDLLKDINAAPETVGANPANVVRVGSTIFFTATTDTHGTELWKSDGSESGTVRVKDINVGNGSSDPRNLTNVNGTLFFAASEGTGRFTLWKTDGTEAGTVLVKDVFLGSSGLESSQLTNVNGTLFFRASDGTTDFELWVSDGTEVGTIRLKDIRPGIVTSNPRYFTEVNGTLFFRAGNGTSGDELWKSDGTELGTVLVKDIRPGSNGSDPRYLTNVNGTLFFNANDGTNGQELWKSDGTEAGTVQVKNIRSGLSNSSPQNLTMVNDTLFFVANDGTSGIELWKSDGTELGTERVKDIRTGASSSSPQFLTNVNGTLFFQANNGVDGEELWKSDGSETGTSRVSDINLGSFGSTPQFLSNVNGVLYFRAFRGSDGVELWKSDGTEPGTVRVADIFPGNQSSNIQNLVNIDGTLFFRANDGISGAELWRSNGTELGTIRVKDIRNGTKKSLYLSDLSLTNVNGTLFFSANNGVNGYELWKTDGTPAGTVQVRDIVPGLGSSTPKALTNVNGTLFFRTGDDADFTRELWKSDGTEAGTIQVSETVDINGTEFVNVDGTLFFRAINGGGVELWKSDGTTSGTMRVKDIRAGVGGSSPTYLTNVNGVLFFVANDGTSGYELWKSDGTELGTVRVQDVAPGALNSLPRYLTNVNGTLFFSANVSTNGTELWKSDGTELGTVLVKDIRSGINGSDPRYLTNVNGTLFFNANDGTNGRELWKSDGTEVGTQMVTDIRFGTGSSDPRYLTNANGVVYFRANDGTHGYELWKSDGTQSGTVLVNDTYVGSSSSDIRKLTVVGDKLYFNANDGINGQELWESDLTTSITQMVFDITQDSGGSNPANITDLNGKLIVSATTEAYGTELYIADISTVLAISSNDIEENAPAGSSVGTFTTTTANAGNTFTYTLVTGTGDNDNGVFTITGDQLIINTSPDFETQSEFSIRVRTTNSNDLFVEKTFVVQVLPVNDNSPVFIDSGTTLSIPDNVAIGVIASVVATDADLPSQIVSYSITGGSDGSRFVVNSSGQLSFIVPPNFASPSDSNFDNVYEVEVTADDGEGGATARTLLVEVLAGLPTINFQINSQSVNELVGNAGITVTSNVPAPFDLLIPIQLSDETATRGTDYEFTSGLDNGFALIVAGSTTTTIIATIDQDFRFEPAESVTLSLLSGSQYLIGSVATHTLEITSDDLPPSVAFTSSSQLAAEGQTAVISAYLSYPSDLQVTVPISYSGTATSGSDFTGPTSLTFAPGVTSVSVPINIVDDQDAESAESIVATLGTPDNAVLDTAGFFPTSHVVLIPQNDAPTISFGTSFREVAENAGTVFVDVLLSHAAVNDIVIPYTVAGTADGQDRTVTPVSSITIPAGQTSAAIQVQIFNDTTNEPGTGETVELLLGDPTSGDAILGSTRTSVLRIDDNDVPRVEFVVNTSTAVATRNGISDFVWENGNTITYTATLSLPSTEPVTVPISVSGSGSVSSGYGVRGTDRDFNTSSAAIIFAPGETSITRTITVYNDTSNEESETILVSLLQPTTSDAILGNRTRQLIVIKDNDPLVSVKGTVNEVPEANTTRNFTISLSAPTNVNVVVPLVWGGTADRKGSDRDYGTDPNFPSSITIPAGQTSRSFDVDILEDSLDEKSETITLTAKEPAGEAKLSNSASDTITIEDDDSPPTVSWDTPDYIIRMEGGAKLTYKLKLNKVSGLDVTIDLAIHEHGAGVVRDTETPITFLGRRLNPFDFGVRGTSKGDKVTIPAGETTAYFTIVFYDDSNFEGDEYITPEITSATNAKIPKGALLLQRKLTIRDNDQPPATSSRPTSNSTVNPAIGAGGIGTLALPSVISTYQGGSSSYSDLQSPTVGPIQVGSPGTLNYGPGVVAIAFNGYASNGLFEGATVFFDANLNGRPDFLDLNGDGIQGDDELQEPVAITGIDGTFSLFLPVEFDVDSNGSISPDEGRLVMIGGVDTSIGLPSVTRLIAPLGSPMLTPLSTIVESLIRVDGLEYGDSLTRVSDAFNIGSTDFATINPVLGAAGDDALATAIERASVKISSTVQQIASLFAGLPGALPIDFLADSVYSEIANRIVAEGSSLDLSVHPVVADLINGVGLRIGTSLELVSATHQEVVAGAAQVIVAGNQRMDALDNTGNVAFLTNLFQIKKVMQVQAADSLQQLTAGNETLANVLSQFTGANLEAKIAAATIGQFIPPALTISNGAIVEGNDGQQVLELTVNLIGEHSLPVSVDYHTEDDIANVADNDYTAVAGSLSWAAGDNTPRTIQIPIHGDNTFEVDENFKVFLSNATNAAVRVGLGYAFIVNDEQFETTPVANGTTSLHTLAVSDSGFLLQHDNVRTLGGDLASPLVATIHGSDDVDDTFQLELSAGNFRTDSLTFVGGGGTGFDTVEVFGGDFQKITQRLTNATDGLTEFDPGDGAEKLNLSWIGMEPFLLNVGSIAEMVFELPAGVTDAILEDADPLDTTNPGMLQLRSPSGLFETTLFANPTTSVVIRAGDGTDTITIGDLDPDFVGTIRIDVNALGTDSVVVNYTGWTSTGTVSISGQDYEVFTKGSAPDLLTLQIQIPANAPTELSLSPTEIDENVAAGSIIGAFTTTDPDAGDTFTYTLVPGNGDADNGDFSITGDQLTINASPDFETKSSYSVRVRTTDQDGLFTEQDFVISVNDVNEAPTALHLSDLVRIDINTTPSSAGSSPANITEVGAFTFFTATTATHGSELWRTDGTESGTVLVKDIFAGSSGSSPRYLTNVNGTLYFVASNSTNGEELWRSDGTDSGTVLVKDIRAGGSSSSPRYLTNVNGTLYFVASNSTNGTELWRSDGTDSGTVVVKDILAGVAGSNPQNLTNVNGTLYFRSTNNTNGTELWRSDGTDSGTVLVKDIRVGSFGSYPRYLTNVNGTLYFSAFDGTNGYELWRSDGTDSGTVLVKDIRAGSSSSYPRYLTNVNGTLYFSAFDGTNGEELWRSDGTDSGTVLVKDIRAGTFSSYPRYLTNVNGTLYFRALDNASGYELWRSDGTDSGTVLVKDIRAGGYGSSPRYLTNVNGTLYFSAFDGTNGEELWRSDGTDSGTVLVKDIRFGGASSNPHYLTNVNGTLYFHAFDNTNGYELWRSDGTDSGTFLVKNIRAGSSGSNPRSLTNVNGTLYLRANDGTNGYELWRSDGTDSGSVLVKDIRAGGYGSNPSYLTNVNGTLYFRAIDNVNGNELWRSDGTDSGIGLVKDIRAGSSSSYPSYLTNVNGTLYFRAIDNVNGEELWRSDGTDSGTVLVKDIFAEGGSSNPRYLTNVNGALYFRARNNTNGYELWRSDGTDSGTVLVKDIRAGSSNSSPRYLTNVNGTLYFSARNNTNGYELWRSDGTDSGTVLVKDILAGVAGSYPQNLTNVNGTLYFSARNNTNGYELWRSDGTDSGTVLVKDILAGVAGSYPQNLTNVNGTLYFRARNNTKGYELWRSDGTDLGTVLIKDIRAGGGSSNTRYLTNVNGTLYFQANDGVNGEELWVSDGTESGTVMVVDLTGDTGGSRPRSIAAMNDLVFFVATTEDAGDELYVLASGAGPLPLELEDSSIDENVPAGFTVGDFSTIDPDAGDAFTYSLVTGTGDTDNAVFTITGDQLTINASPDFEAQSSYSIRVRTTDQGGLFFDRDFVIQINDLNETPTGLSLPNDSIAENVASGSFVGAFSTSDPDTGDTFGYTLVSGTGDTDNAAFTITGNQLTINVSPDFESKSSYSVRVRTTDQDGLFTEQEFVISVTDVNEAPTAIALNANSIAENVPAGTAVGMLSTTDPDSGNTFTYSLVTGTGDTDNAAFSIDGDELTINASPDFETKSSYSVRVRTTDQDGLFTEQDFVISVNDLNEVPTAIALTANSIAENVPAGTAVGMLSTTDPDSGNTFTYNLVTGSGDTDNAAFTITGDQLTINASPDFENKSSYSIRVRTTDQDDLFTEQDFVIAISDVNEAPSALALSANNVDENVAAGTTIGSLSTIDQDTSNTFTYSFVTGSGDADNAAFTITGDQLSINASPDFETKSSYSVRVRTTDQGGLSVETPLLITVNDIFEQPTPSIIELDNLSPGFVVERGTWGTSASIGGFVGTNYRFAGGGDRLVSFNTAIEFTGTYEVFANWTSHPNRASNAPIQVIHADGASTVIVDQRINGGTFQSLGIHRFEAGEIASVTIGTRGTNGSVIADAVRWVPVQTEITIDNTDPEFSIVSGVWNTSTTIPGFIGSDYRFTGGGAKVAQFTPGITAGGWFEVFANWTDHPNRATNARYIVTHSGGTSTVLMNQTVGGGSFQSLGTYWFDAGQQGSIAVSTLGTNGSVIADAIKLVPSVQRTIELDNQSPQFSIESGTWNTSSAVGGFVGTNYRFAGGGDRVARFTPEIVESGSYEVFSNWTSHPNRATNAVIEIVHALGTQSVTVDQTQNGGSFQSLGIYQFDAGTSGSIAFRTLGSNGTVVADAIRLVPIEMPAMRSFTMFTSKTGQKNSLDINGDNLLTPLDALLVINGLRTASVKAEGESIEWESPEFHRLDANLDGSVTPLDALLIINQISRNRNSLSAGEGEDSSTPLQQASPRRLASFIAPTIEDEDDDLELGRSFYEDIASQQRRS